MKDYDKWNEIKKETSLLKQEVKIREGEIRWCKVGINIGFEIIGKGEFFGRPVLVLKKFSGDVFLGCPLTSKAHQGNWYFNLEHNDETRCIILNQAKVFDRKRLQHKMYELNEEELLLVKQAYCNLILS